MDNVLFLQDECEEWNRKNPTKKCCNAPNLMNVLKQDRAMDEAPTLYERCKNCQYIVKKRNDGAH